MYSKGQTKEWRETYLKEFLGMTMLNSRLFPMAWLKETDFFTAPASTRHHAAYEGGLFDHCMNMANALLRLRSMGVTPAWQRQESPIIVGLLHDATKFGLYENSNGVWVHNPDWAYASEIHGEDSMLKVKAHMKLTPEEEQCIRWHMGAYEGAHSWAKYDCVIREYPNVLWTHTADMIASKLMEDDT